MTHFGTWVSYSGAARLTLAAVLLAAAAAVTFAGIRLPLPARPARPGRKAAVLMLVAWALAIAAFLACVVVYIQQARRRAWYTDTSCPPITSSPSRSSRRW